MKKSHTTRFLSLLLSLVLSVSLCPPALADWVDFSDVSPSHWAYDSIMYCSEWNIVTGYEDGRFLPENQVTRAQFISMLTRAFYSGEVEEAKQSQPAGSPWYWANKKVADDVNMTRTLVEINDSAMNRYEMSMALKNTCINQIVRINQGKGVTDEQRNAAKAAIKDWNNIPTSPYRYDLSVQVCYALGVLTGMSDGSFHGEQSMTRAQACVVITRMLDLIQGEPPAAPSQPQQPETPEQSGTGLLANGQEATVENVQAILDEIQREYPDETSWGIKTIPGTNYYKDGGTLSDARSLIMTWGADTTYACGGWATMVSNRIFGMTGAPVREITDISKARPGDIVIKRNSDGGVAHVAIFTSYDPTPNGSFTMGHFYTCDGNIGNGENGVVQWNYSRDAREFGTRYRIYTRYPA